MDDKNRKSPDHEDEETAAQRLRRILSASQGKEQEVDGIDSTLKKIPPKDQDSEKNTELADVTGTQDEVADELDEPEIIKDDTSQIPVQADIEMVELSDLLEKIKTGISSFSSRFKRRKPKTSGEGKPPRDRNGKPFFKRLKNNPLGMFDDRIVGFLFWIDCHRHSWIILCDLPVFHHCSRIALRG